ncbi:MAG: hypothetical protein HC798_03965 [Polaribacter sp.]|nr:hypothetical protein [Polaribacter sp.]
MLINIIGLYDEYIPDEADDFDDKINSIFIEVKAHFDKLKKESLEKSKED